MPYNFRFTPIIDLTLESGLCTNWRIESSYLCRWCPNYYHDDWRIYFNDNRIERSWRMGQIIRRLSMLIT